MSEPVRGRNLTYSIANSLGVAIVTGTYSADNPIPIKAALCRQFDASRTVLREAVKMLTAKGLLGPRPDARGRKHQPITAWRKPKSPC
jgi:DNA-binding FadR family transcriptional regulator